MAVGSEKHSARTAVFGAHNDIEEELSETVGHYSQ